MTPDASTRRTPPRPHDDPFLPPAWPDWVHDRNAPQWANNQGDDSSEESWGE